MTKYTLDKKEEYERRLSEIREAWFNKMAGGGGASGEGRLALALALLELGVEPEDTRDGLIINNRVVIAVNKSKYRYAQNYEWKRYYELPFVVAVAKGERYRKESVAT